MNQAVGPGQVSDAYAAMAPLWGRINAVLGGGDAMKEQGKLLLPQHDQEESSAYDQRLHENYLVNISEQTLDTWSGRPFSDPVGLSNINENLLPLMDDIDLCGNNMQVFMRAWFREGLAKAFSHVLVDFTRAQQEGPRTVLDDMVDLKRPYLVHLCPESVIDIRTEIIDGTERVVHLRLRTSRIAQGADEFSTRVVDQIKVYDPGRVRVYEWGSTITSRGRTGKPGWVLKDQVEYDFPFVPLVTFYAHRQGLMLGKPPLLDIVDLNIAHWRSNSDQVSILKMSRFPILALAGGTKDDLVTIGPRQWLHSTDPTSKWYYVEHTGQAIAAGKADLERLEERMRDYGTEFLRKRPGRETATARALESAEATATLRDAVLRFKDAVAQVLHLMGMWVQLPTDAGTIEISTDFMEVDDNLETMKLLAESRKNGDIARQLYIKELIRRGVLSDDFSEEKNEDLLMKEKATSV